MKYVVHIVMAVAVAAVVAYGMYLTKNPHFLWGLLVYLPLGTDVVSMSKQGQPKD
jgi:hypothetical protein